MAPGSEVYPSAFERKATCNSRTNSPAGTCHEYTLISESLHRCLSDPPMEAVLRDAVIITKQHFSTLASEWGKRDCLAVEDSLDFFRHSLHVLVEYKVSCIQPNQLGFWQITQVRLGSGRHEEGVLLSPGNQCPGLMRAESGLPIGIECDVGLVVLQQINLVVLHPGPVKQCLIEYPIVRINGLGILRAY